MSMIQFLIGAAMAAATPPTAAVTPPALPDARPAMWVVNDEDTIVYLFGTFHALDGKSDWFNDEVRTAFTQSQQLVLEALVPPRPGNAAVRGPLTLRGRSVGPMLSVAGSPTFLSTAREVMAAGRSQGMSSDIGADAVLRRAAEAVGKPVGGLETPEFQIGMMSRMPSAVRPDSPAQAVAAMRQMGAILAFLQAAWNRGDTDSFGAMLEDMRLKSPATYKVMFHDRNERWAGWVADRLTQPGVVFVAVGAGHLSGPDSLQHKLADRNIRSARLN